MVKSTNYNELNKITLARWVAKCLNMHWIKNNIKSFKIKGYKNLNFGYLTIRLWMTRLELVKYTQQNLTIGYIKMNTFQINQMKT